MKTKHSMQGTKRNDWLRRFTALACLTVPITALASGPVPDFRVSRISLREKDAVDVVHGTIEQTFQSDFRVGEGRDMRFRENNNTNTWHYDLLYTHRFTLNEQWQLRLGVDLDRRDLGDNHSNAPRTLQSYAAVIALDYAPTPQSRIFIEAHPGVYMEHDSGGETFDVPTILGGVFPLVGDKLYLAAGVSLSILRSYPVLPIGGIIWHINEAWDLEACLPNPRIYFKTTENLQIWAGGELTGGAFRLDTANSPLPSRGKGTYYEIRAGGGFIYTGWKGIAVDVGGGWAFERKFDMQRIPSIAATEGTPFAKITFSATF